LDRDSEFGEFVDARALVMRRTAYLLCGDWHRAEDVVQQSLIKMYVAWSRVRKDSVDAYARKVLVRTAIDETRRGFFQRERTVDAVPERAVTDSASDLDLREALDALPPGQRAVVVLRYWEDLSITETARILGRTEGTVKSQAAKGLAALRALLEDEPELRIHRSEVIRKGRTRLARRRTAIATAMAFVVLVGLGSVGYLARSQQTSDAGASATLDHNAELTRVLREANVVPPGVTPQDVDGRQALTFGSTNNGSRSAVARLTDVRGTSGLSIVLTPGTQPENLICIQPGWARDCYVNTGTGDHVTTGFHEEPGGIVYWEAEISRPDGTQVVVRSDNRDPATGTVTRPEPVLGREAVIKIATLPGLIF
jgi:RNA polymerase sigma-70 factor (sigma-E family)